MITFTVIIGVLLLVVAGFFIYTEWDDNRRIREAQGRMRDAELKVRAGIAAFRREMEQAAERKRKVTGKDEEG